jgi:hypothetical protein
MSFLSFILVGLSEGAPIRRASIRRIQQVTEGYDTRVDFAILNQQLPAMDSISSLVGMLRCDEVRGSSLPTAWPGTTDIEKMIGPCVLRAIERSASMVDAAGPRRR